MILQPEGLPFIDVYKRQGAVSKVFYGDVVNGDSTVSQAIESNKQILQDEIDTLKIQ